MNLVSSSPLRRTILSVTTLISLLGPIVAHAATAPALLDDFSDALRTSTGAERVLADDKSVNGQSRATQTCEDNVLAVAGELVPARGMFAFISLVLPLSPDWQPQDVSGYEGIRLRVKMKQGSLSVQAGSSEIENFDFHTSSVIAKKPRQFEEVRIPFREMKRAFSEQTALNLKTITSINLVAVGMAKGDFAYEVNEIGFY